MKTTPLTAERRKQLEDRLAYLDSALERHRRSRRLAPWWLLGLVLCVPAAMVWGPIAAFYVALFSIAMMGIVYYVAWNHGSECVAEHESVVQMLDAGTEASVESEVAASVTATPGNADDARTGEERDRQRAQHDRYRRPHRISL